MKMQKLEAKTFQSRWQVSGGGEEKSHLQTPPGDRTEQFGITTTNEQMEKSINLAKERKT